MSKFFDKFRWRIRNWCQALLMPSLKLEHHLPSGLTVAVESPAGWSIYNEIFVDGEYDAAINRIIQGYPAGTLNILDIGANVGFFTLRVADLLGRLQRRQDMRAVLIEGSPKVHARLIRQMSRQGKLMDNLRVINGLAGKREGTGVLHEIAYDGMNSLAPRRLSRHVEVPFVNIAELCAEMDPIHLLKCDIEGAEELTISSYPDVLAKTLVAVFEFHHSAIDRKACLRALADAGLEHHEVVRDRGEISVELFWR